jgi:hypothetical protein
MYLSTALVVVVVATAAVAAASAVVEESPAQGYRVAPIELALG